MTPTSTGLACVPPGLPPFYFAFWIPILLFDGILCITTLLRGFKEFFSSGPNCRCGKNLVRVLARDSAFYFLRWVYHRVEVHHHDLIVLLVCSRRISQPLLYGWSIEYVMSHRDNCYIMLIFCLLAGRPATRPCWSLRSCRLRLREQASHQHSPCCDRLWISTSRWFPTVRWLRRRDNFILPAGIYWTKNALVRLWHG